MTTLTPSVLWVQDASNLSDGVSLSMLSWSSPRVATVEARKRASGRMVAVSRPGIPREAMFGVVITDRDDLEWLETMLARLVLVRSPRGHRVWGVFGKVEFSEPGGRVFAGEATLSVAEVTTTEAV